jgi:hypothetical protein
MIAVKEMYDSDSSWEMVGPWETQSTPATGDANNDSSSDDWEILSNCDECVSASGGREESCDAESKAPAANATTAKPKSWAALFGEVQKLAWACQICTLNNEGVNLRCTACDAPKQETVVDGWFVPIPEKPKKARVPYDDKMDTTFDGEKGWFMTHKRKRLLWGPVGDHMPLAENYKLAAINKRGKRWATPREDKYAAAHGHSLKYKCTQPCCCPMHGVIETRNSMFKPVNLHRLPWLSDDMASWDREEPVTDLDLLCGPRRGLGTISVNRHQRWKVAEEVLATATKMPVSFDKYNALQSLTVRFKLPVVGAIVHNQKLGVQDRQSQRQARKCLRFSKYVFFPLRTTFDMQTPWLMKPDTAYLKRARLFSDTTDGAEILRPVKATSGAMYRREGFGEVRQLPSEVWSARTSSPSEHYEVDLGGSGMAIAAIGTQGWEETYTLPTAAMRSQHHRHFKTPYRGPTITVKSSPKISAGEWVTRYEILGRSVGGKWTSLGIFDGNINCHDEVAHQFRNQELRCRYIRVRPLDGCFQKRKTMQVRVYGFSEENQKAHSFLSPDAQEFKHYAMHISKAGGGVAKHSPLGGAPTKENFNPKLRSHSTSGSGHNRCYYGASDKRKELKGLLKRISEEDAPSIEAAGNVLPLKWYKTISPLKYR